MKLAPIASGSSGNSIYVGSETTHILVDAGISGKRIMEGLESLDLHLEDIHGILITHEHSDHISGLGVISRKSHTPIYATKETIIEIQRTKALGKMDASVFHEIEPDIPFMIGDVLINPIRVSHDAANPVAYSLANGEKKVAIMTDLGCYDEYIVENLKNMDALVIEANHNVNMLQVGPYPYYLKQRILGEQGHLSNETCARLLGEIIHDKLQHIILGHLSKENNYEEIAYETVRMELNMCGNESDCPSYQITVAKRNSTTQAVEI